MEREARRLERIIFQGKMELFRIHPDASYGRLLLDTSQGIRKCSDSGTYGYSLSISFSLNRLCASFVVNETDPRSVNSLTELAGVLALFLLVCVGNWSITCLMDGEGRFKDIIIAVGYGITPATVGYVLATLLSRVIADNEQAFYGLLIGIGIAYAVILVLMGIMQVHNYTLGKTLITLFLTFVAVLIIIFLALLLLIW